MEKAGEGAEMLLSIMLIKTRKNWNKIQMTKHVDQRPILHQQVPEQSPLLPSQRMQDQITINQRTSVHHQNGKIIKFEI